MKMVRGVAAQRNLVGGSLLTLMCAGRLDFV